MIIGSVPCGCPPAVYGNFRRHAWAKCKECGHVTYDPECGPVAGQLVCVAWHRETRQGLQFFTIGLIVACGKVVVATPIARKAVGRDVTEVLAFYRRQPGARVRWQRHQPEGG
jgi:hypothetical protein